MIKTCFLTDPGKIRSHNEDSVTILNNDNGEYILAVADGMGGHKAGEVASSIATTHLEARFASLDTLGDKENAIEWLRKVATEINDKIFEYTRQNPDSKGMGTTLVVALKTDDYLFCTKEKIKMIGVNFGYSNLEKIKNKLMKLFFTDESLYEYIVEDMSSNDNN